MKAHKLPSGNWRVQVDAYTADGQRIRRSFTDPDKKRALYLAQEFAITAGKAALSGTVHSAMDDYIRSRTAVLSPATIRGYVNIQKAVAREAPGFYSMKLTLLRDRDVQNVVDLFSSSGLSQKSVRNRYGLITAALNYADVHLNDARLPQRTKPELNIPDATTVKKICALSKDTPLEIPILLAAFGPLRRGEICALEMDDFAGSTLHVHRDMVLGPENKWVTKAPKTTESDRYIILPDNIASIVHARGSITDLNPHELTLRFARFLEKNDIPQFRFHDLRHFCVSFMAAQGVSMETIMKRGGWKTDHVVRSVYRHSLADLDRAENARINKKFSKFV